MAMRNRRSSTRKNRGGRALRRVFPMKVRRIRRGVLHNEPTFVETFKVARDNLAVPIGDGSGVGKYFKVRIQDVPQVTQYSNLYTQYRINWVKIILLPQFNTQSSDANAQQYNVSQSLNSYGMARIVYSIQDSPNQADPTSENEVLEDNGCKIKAMGSKWSCSFKPVPDVVMTNGASGSGVIPIRLKNKSWFNFDTAEPNNNPYHGGVKAWITLPGLAASAAQPITWYAYYKVSFSLRDPQ